jgi:hypothetical protein
MGRPGLSLWRAPGRRVCAAGHEQLLFQKCFAPDETGFATKRIRFASARRIAGVTRERRGGKAR